MSFVTVPVEQLTHIVCTVLQSAGVSPEDAAIVADNLLTAETSGMPSHGLQLLKVYMERIHQGAIDPKAVPTSQAMAGNMFKVNGANALGPVAAMYAMNLCIDQARRSGNAIATIHHMNHIGMVGYYTRAAAKQGMLAFVCTNSMAFMAPFGGQESLLGTNPICVSFDAGKYGDFTLDIATTVAARNKIRIYQKEGKPLPPGWALDENGMETTDPAAALAGSMLPMGGHKGYGLAMTVDMLCGILAEGDLSYEATETRAAGLPFNTGAYISVVDLHRFLPEEVLQSRMEGWLDRVKQSQIRPGFTEILLPGELENRRMAQSGGSLPILESTYRDIMKLYSEFSS